MNHLTSRLKAQSSLRRGWPLVTRITPILGSTAATSNLLSGHENHVSYRSFSDNGRGRGDGGRFGGSSGGRGGGGRGGGRFGGRDGGGGGGRFGGRDGGGGGGGRGAFVPRGRRGDTFGNSGRGSGALSRFLERQRPGKDWGQRPDEDGQRRLPGPSMAGAFGGRGDSDDQVRRQHLEDVGVPVPKTGFASMDDEPDDADIDDDAFFDELDGEEEDSDYESDEEEDDDKDDGGISDEVLKGFQPDRYDGQYYYDEEDYDEFDKTMVENELELMKLIGPEKFEQFRVKFMEELLKNYKGREYHDKYLELMYMFYLQDGAELAALLKAHGGADDDVEVPANLQEPTSLIKFVEEAMDRTDDRDPFAPHVLQQMNEDFFFNSDAVDDEGDFLQPREKNDPITKLIDSGTSPLADHGSSFGQFMQAMEYHPSDYAGVSRISLHPDSKREPRPIFPPNRKNPPLEFVTTYVRFIFVSGFPVPQVEDGEFDLANPLHQHEIQKLVAKICGVKTEQVSPASKTSAFVGFNAVDELLSVSPPEKMRPSNITINICSNVPEQLSPSSPECIIEISNLPKSVGAERLVRDLFPTGSPLHETFGTLAPEDVVAKDHGSVLIRFKSKELASQALSSEMLSFRLSELGAWKARYFKARREIVTTGMGGPRKQKEMRAYGPKLVVDGDIPTRNFFISHADTIQLRNLDKSLTKEQISDFFQPFCSDPRDVDTSIEFVTCLEGTRISKAYVGFDRKGEMEQVLKAFNGTVKLGKRTTFIKSVKERLTKEGKALREPRPNRNIEDLLKDLNDWEEHADPEDVEALVNAGVTREVLGEYLRNVRYHNPTFSALDQAKSDERLTQNRERGHDYRSLVREYISNLRQSIATREDPGSVYRGLFLRGDEIDMSIFDLDKEVQARIREKRRKWYGE